MATNKKPTVNTRLLKKGFGSYLDGILPEDIATACGAFSVSMRQTRNITSVPIEKYAQVVRSLELTKGLGQVAGTTEITEPVVNGEPGWPFNGRPRYNIQQVRKPPLQSSTVPVNLPLVHEGLAITALGSGPHQTYTMSDLLGCMSGLPYDWVSKRRLILSLETIKLRHIYHQLFLAVTWEAAKLKVTVNPGYDTVSPYVPAWTGPGPEFTEHPAIPGVYNKWYTITISVTSKGGGYGRGTAPDPNPVVISPNQVGASVTLTVGRDEHDAGAVGAGSLGRLSFTINNGGKFYYEYGSNSTASTAPNVVATVQCPPIATLPVAPNGAFATNGVNTPPGTGGWSGMNQVVQAYITQANDEILVIKAAKPKQAAELNKLWDYSGDQLNIEQRAINLAQDVLVPGSVREDRAHRDNLWPNFPSIFYAFTDMIPTFAQNTDPHMSAQTLEAISNFGTVGGQSIVGKMRESRNQERLSSIGIVLDNNIPDKLSKADKIQLLDGVVNSAGLKQTTPPLPTPGYPGWTGAVLVAATDAGAITDIEVLEPGSGYTAPPDIIIEDTDSVTTTAEATANIATGSVSDIVVDIPGAGYINAPDVLIIRDPTEPFTTGMVEAEAVAVVVGGEISEIVLTEPGTDYTLPPTVVIRNLVGVDAVATAILVNGAVDSVQITDPGKNYIAPTVQLTGGLIMVPYEGTPYGQYDQTSQDYIIDGSPVDNGQSVEPGSFAGSDKENELADNLNIILTSGTLLPATLTPAEALDETDRCNCDNWLN